MGKRGGAVAGTVSWVDLQTPDLQKARRFYGELLGWTFDGSEDETRGSYTMARVAGCKVAGMAKLREGSQFPPMWSVYLATDDVEATARKVSEAGGKVVVPPMDVMGQGRMAYFADPTGAHFGVWQGQEHRGAELVHEPGTMAWHELYTRGAAEARDFYAAVFGLEPKRLDAPGMEYWTLHKGELAAGGVMEMAGRLPDEMPPHWNTYFAVADVDAAAGKVQTLGGKIVQPPFDSPYGRIAFVSDPFGASFMLQQAPPER